MSRQQLAQINVARLLEPIDAPAIADFVAALAPVNQRADVALGFFWRLPAAQVPTIDEALDRLALLRARGPSPDAFTFRGRFPLH